MARTPSTLSQVGFSFAYVNTLVVVHLYFFSGTSQKSHEVSSIYITFVWYATLAMQSCLGEKERKTDDPH